MSLAASPRGVLTSKVTYAITVTNGGPGDATGVRLTATYAAGLSYAGPATACGSPAPAPCTATSPPAVGRQRHRCAALTGLLVRC